MEEELSKKVSYKEHLDDEENKALRQIVELYSKAEEAGKASNKYQLGGGFNYFATDNYYNTGYYEAPMFYQMANQLNQRGGNFNESVGKVNNIVSGLKELKFMDVYDYWKNNTPIEGGKYTDGEFRGILANLKSELLKGKNEAQLDGEIMALREEILKIPGIVVKVTDWWKDVLEGGYNADSNKGYVDVIGDTCLSVGTNNKSDPNCGDYQKYGPFRYAVGPSGNENPKNSDVFNYLQDPEKFALMDILSKGGQDVKVFGYGFSGSGKTYTLLQGSEKDKSLFVQTLDKINEKNLPFATNAIGVDIFYPMLDKDANNRISFFKKHPVGKEMTKKLNKFKQKLNDNKSSGNTKLIKEQLEGIENTLLDYLLVLPTSNNPRSSRAFTIVSINLSNGSSIKFID